MGGFWGVWLGPPTTQNVCHCLFLTEFTILINLGYVSSCYVMNWANPAEEWGDFGASGSDPPPLKMSVIAYFWQSWPCWLIWNRFQVVTSWAELAHIFHIYFWPPQAHPPAGIWQTFFSLLIYICKSLLTISKFVTFSARLTPPGSRSKPGRLQFFYFLACIHQWWPKINSLPFQLGWHALAPGLSYSSRKVRAIK